MKKYSTVTVLLVLLSCTIAPIKNPDGTWNTSNQTILDIALNGTSEKTQDNFRQIPEADKQLYLSYYSFINSEEKEKSINQLSTDEKRSFVESIKERIREEGFRKTLIPLSSYTPEGKIIAEYHEKDLKTIVSNCLYSQIPIIQVGLIRNHIENNELYVLISFKNNVTYNTIQTTKEKRIYATLDKFGYQILRLNYQIVEKMYKDKYHIKGIALFFSNNSQNFVSKNEITNEDCMVFSNASDISAFVKMQLTDKSFLNNSMVIINNTRIQL